MCFRLALDVFIFDSNQLSVKEKGSQYCGVAEYVWRPMFLEELKAEKMTSVS